MKLRILETHKTIHIIQADGTPAQEESVTSRLQFSNHQREHCDGRYSDVWEDVESEIEYETEEIDLRPKKAKKVEPVEMDIEGLRALNKFKKIGGAPYLRKQKGQ